MDEFSFKYLILDQLFFRIFQPHIISTNFFISPNKNNSVSRENVNKLATLQNSQSKKVPELLF